MVEDGTRNKKAARSSTIQSISIAARFLQTLANAPAPMALSEIAKATHTGASTAHRYLQSLIVEGLAFQDSTSGRYDLGPAALSIGIGALRRIEPVDVAAKHMKRLSDRIAASGGVALWTDRGPTIVRWYRSAYFSISTVSLGDVLPIDNSACGLVFQAFLPSERIKAARALQPSGFRGSPPSASTLRAIREARGVELNEHLFTSITGKAAAVFDAQNEIACVMTTVSSVEAADREGHTNALFEAARAASTESSGV